MNITVGDRVSWYDAKRHQRRTGRVLNVTPAWIAVQPDDYERTRAQVLAPGQITKVGD
jgi:hypothetical protein